MLPDRLRRFLDGLPDDRLVLDVGGWALPDPRADWVIDIGPFETRNWFLTLRGDSLPERERARSERWVQRDICAAEPWPFADGMFDYVLCMQTLEDVRDPVRVCEEIARVGRAGYVETPTAVTELTRGVQSPYWCGWQHHRWLVEHCDGGLTFVAKPHHVHSPLWPAVRSPRQLSPAGRDVLRFEWEGSFEAREEIFVVPQDLDRRLLGIVRADVPKDPIGDALRAGRAAVDDVAAAGRRAARRLAGRH